MQLDLHSGPGSVLAGFLGNAGSEFLVLDKGVSDCREIHLATIHTVAHASASRPVDRLQNGRLLRHEATRQRDPQMF